MELFRVLPVILYFHSVFWRSITEMDLKNTVEVNNNVGDMISYRFMLYITVYAFVWFW